MKAIKFKNPFSTDFSWKYDGIEYTFPAGQEIYLEDYKAQHFAKHLADRELTAKGILTDNVGERAKIEALCLPADEAITPLEAIQVNEKAKKGKKKEEPVEFPDLHANKKKA